MTDPNREFELRTRYVAHRESISLATAAEAVCNASPELAQQCTDVPKFGLGERPPTDIVGQYEAAIVEKMAAGMTRENAARAIKDEAPGLHKGHCGTLGAARYAAEHARRISQEQRPDWLEWCEHCAANPLSPPPRGRRAPVAAGTAGE